MCVSTKPVWDATRVVGAVALRRKGQPPISLPLEVLEGSPHLLDCKLHLLFVSFGSRLTLRPMDTVEIFTICIQGYGVGHLGVG